MSQEQGQNTTAPAAGIYRKVRFQCLFRQLKQLGTGLVVSAIRRIRVAAAYFIAGKPGKKEEKDIGE